ncbi:MAG: HlyD family efflux transporter periplasmic adaptor subunit [Alphaproteobacteria bacterium]
MKAFRRWAWRVAGAVVVVSALAYAFRPQPVPVDTAVVARGPLVVTVDDDGETRVREVYLVSAPLPGRVLRFDGDVGDPVTAEETVLATILPTDPTFLDIRTRSELEAVVRAADAARTLAEAEVARTEAEVDYAVAEHERATRLFDRGTISAAALDRARMGARTQEAALMTARAALNVREHELATARASLIGPSADDRDVDRYSGCCFLVRAPVSGRILRIVHESEGVVAAGAPLVEIGDPHDLEVVVDLLSSDSVRVEEGAAALIEDWGGPSLNGRLRRIEPYAFTKVSALGIEEQRVNVIIDFVDPPELWRQLGHGYQVEARIVVWQGDDVLKSPQAALFRDGNDWAVFVLADGRASLRRIEVGHMDGRHAEVLDGLAAGDTVVLHPSDRVTDGVRAVARPGG